MLLYELADRVDSVIKQLDAIRPKLQDEMPSDKDEFYACESKQENLDTVRSILDNFWRTNFYEED